MTAPPPADRWSAEELAAAAPEPKFGIEIPEAPACARAASLAGMLLRITRKPTWAALAQSVTDGEEEVLVRLADYLLTPAQLELLDAFADVIELAVAEPGSTVCVCDTCGDWSVIGSRGVPSGCRTTAGCRGRVVKAPRARRSLRTGGTEAPTRCDAPADPITDGTERAAYESRTEGGPAGPGPHEPAGAEPRMAQLIPFPGRTDRAGSRQATPIAQAAIPSGTLTHPAEVPDDAWAVDPDEGFGDTGDRTRPRPVRS